MCFSIKVFLFIYGFNEALINLFQLSCRKDSYGVFSEPVDPEEVQFLQILT